MVNFRPRARDVWAGRGGAEGCELPFSAGRIWRSGAPPTESRASGRGDIAAGRDGGGVREPLACRGGDRRAAALRQGPRPAGRRAGEAS